MEDVSRDPNLWENRLRTSSDELLRALGLNLKGMGCVKVCCFISPSDSLLGFFHIVYGATQLDGGCLALEGDKEQGGSS